MTTKPRVSLVRSSGGQVWHRLEGTAAACGATLKSSTTICGFGSPRDVIRITASPKLPLCPMCF